MERDRGGRGCCGGGGEVSKIERELEKRYFTEDCSLSSVKNQTTLGWEGVGGGGGERERERE